MGFRGQDKKSLLREVEMYWMQALGEYEERADAAYPHVDALQQLEEAYYELKEINSSMLRLRAEVLVDTLANEAIAMGIRQNILLFNGVPEDPDMDVKQTILVLIQVKLGIAHVTSSSLERCHRLGTICNVARPILVQFRDHSTKVEVLNSKSNLMGTSVVVVEFLTKLRQKVFIRARDYFGATNVWTLDGIIHIKIPSGYAKVITNEELDVLFAQHPKDAATMSVVLPACRVIYIPGGYLETI